MTAALRKILPLTFLVLLQAMPARAFEIFADDLYDRYSRAFDLNDEGHYLRAYREMSAVDAEMTRLIARLPAGSLADESDFMLFWDVKKSVAEIAYKLGLHAVMARVEGEMTAAIEQNTAIESDERDVYGSALAKIGGDRCYLTGDYDLAERHLREALRLNPFDADFVWKTRDDLAQLYYKRERYDLALAQLDTILSREPFADESRLGADRRDLMDVKSQRALCRARVGDYDAALSEIETVVNYYRAGDKRSRGEALRKKAKILMLRYDAGGRYDPAAPKCYSDYLAIARDYIDERFVEMDESQREQYWMAEQPFVTDAYRLEDRAPALLYDVALYSKAVLLQMGRVFSPSMTKPQRKAALASIRVDWKTLQRKMPPNSTAIEFITYERQGQPFMAALVLSKRSRQPLFVPIVAVDSVMGMTLSTGLTVEQTLGMAGSDMMKGALYGDSTLMPIVWNDALVAAIGDSEKVYFAADGIFHQIAVEYLVPPAIADKKFFRLTSTRLLAERRDAFSGERALLLGGVDYGEALAGEVGGQSDNDRVALDVFRQLNAPLGTLNAARDEVDSIYLIRGARASDLIVHNDSVTERMARQMMPRFNIVSIATHGEFAGLTVSGNDLNPAQSDTQLSRSMLFLAGANAALLNRDIDPSRYDGVLSAREIASLDLSGVDLLVLSACMSGLGYITPDGVFGLQRGLKTAGAGSVVASLWHVDDRASSVFIRALYTRLVAGDSLHDAFYAARSTVRQTVLRTRTGRIQRNGNFDNPYYYNSFLLIDAFE